MLIKLLEKLFKKKKEPQEVTYTFTNPYSHKEITFHATPFFANADSLEYELTNEQKEFATKEVDRINHALSLNQYSQILYIDVDDLEFASFTFNPYTPTGKIKLNPCCLSMHFRTKEGIPSGLSIHYDINDNPKTASFWMAYYMKNSCSYTIDFHYVNKEFHVTKVIKTYPDGNYRKLYQIKKEEIHDN